MITKKFDRDINRIRDRYANRCTCVSINTSADLATIALHFGEVLLSTMIYTHKGQRQYSHNASLYTSLNQLIRVLDAEAAAIRGGKAA